MDMECGIRTFGVRESIISNDTSSNVSVNTEVDLSGTWKYTTSEYLWKTFSPALLIVGTVGNLLTITVLSQPRLRRTSTAIFLIALAVSDLLSLYFGLLRQIILHYTKSDVRLWTDSGCKFHIWLTYFALQNSAWALVAVTLERTTCLWFPTKFKAICTKKTAGFSVIITVISLLLLNCHFLFGHGLYIDPDFRRLACYPGKESHYEHFVRIHWPWIDFCVAVLIPFIILTICNTGMVYKLFKNQKKLHRHGSKGNEKQAFQITRTIVIANLTFLVCLAPGGIFFIVQFQIVDRGDSYLAYSCTELLMYINTCVNFIIYFLFAHRFRRETLLLLRKSAFLHKLLRIRSSKRECSDNTNPLEMTER